MAKACLAVLTGPWATQYLMSCVTDRMWRRPAADGTSTLPCNERQSEGEVLSPRRSHAMKTKRLVGTQELAAYSFGGKGFLEAACMMSERRHMADLNTVETADSSTVARRHRRSRSLEEYQEL